MNDSIVSGFAKDCAKNYEKGVEFSIRFIWGPLTQVVNVPRGVQELEHLSSSRKREYFKSLLYGFLEMVDVASAEGDINSLRIQYLPLQSRDTNVYTYFEKQSTNEVESNENL